MLASVAIMPPCERCASSNAAFRVWIRMIRIIGGCVTSGTPMTSCSGSSDQDPKPRRSNVASDSSCTRSSALELSETKTLITHARTSAARFLGYEITVQHNDRKITAGRRSVNGGIRLSVPREVIATKCVRYMRRGKPAQRPELMNEEAHAIISRYGAEYRGIVQYYLLAGDVYRLDRLRWVMLTSLLKTLARKHDSTVTKIARKYAATIETPHGPRTCMQAVVDRGEAKQPLVATFGGIPLRRQRTAILTDRVPLRANSRRKELIHRLLAGQCEICGEPEKVRVHQIRKLADLDKLEEPQPEWAQIMARRRRKTLVVCEPCSASIHPRRAPASITT